MPYKTLNDLPIRIQNILPHHAQEIYKSAFNSAYALYEDESIAHATAWTAVKRNFEKVNGIWVECTSENGFY